MPAPAQGVGPLSAGLTESERTELAEERFAAADADGDGQLTQDEVIAAHEEAERLRRQERAARMIEALDADDNGTRRAVHGPPGQASRSPPIIEHIAVAGRLCRPRYRREPCREARPKMRLWRPLRAGRRAPLGRCWSRGGAGVDVALPRRVEPLHRQIETATNDAHRRCPRAAGRRSGENQRLQEQARVTALETALAALPERQRQAVVLRNLEGLSSPEIGAVMDLSVDAVESLLSRGRRGLKATLAGRDERMLVDRIAEMTADERSEYADRLEAVFTRRGRPTCIPARSRRWRR